MICRIWHGWTAHADADSFEHIVRSELLPPLHAKQVTGFRGAQILRLARAGQTEFVHMLWFDDMDAVRALAGNDYERPMLNPKAQALLRRCDHKTEHYEVRENTFSH
jgi:hypothetical protein